MGFDTISPEIISELSHGGIPANGILLLCMIVGKSRGSGVCTMLTSRMARVLNIDSRSCRRLKSMLVKNEYITESNANFGTGSKQPVIRITDKTVRLWNLENGHLSPPKRTLESAKTDSSVPHNKQRTNKEQRPADEPRTRYGGRGSPVIKNDEGVPIL